MGRCLWGPPPEAGFKGVAGTWVLTSVDLLPLCLALRSAGYGRTAPRRTLALPTAQSPAREGAEQGLGQLGRPWCPPTIIQSAPEASATLMCPSYSWLGFPGPQLGIQANGLCLIVVLSAQHSPPAAGGRGGGQRGGAEAEDKSSSCQEAESPSTGLSDGLCFSGLLAGAVTRTVTPDSLQRLPHGGQRVLLSVADNPEQQRLLGSPLGARHASERVVGGYEIQLTPASQTISPTLHWRRPGVEGSGVLCRHTAGRSTAGTATAETESVDGGVCRGRAS